MAGELPPLNPLPFDEAIEHFRGKLNLSTKSWQDLQTDMHARAFIVAGAQKRELLAGLRSSVDDALAKGTTLADFRKRFDGLVTEHGWSHTGTPGWRSRVIYETNLRTSYQAGRYKQMTSPETLAGRPFWEYRHGNPTTPRLDHQSWDGKVLPASDAWWKTHYPPNGWGCTCVVFTLSRDDMERLGKELWENPAEGGVPEEWAYNVGEAAWGLPPAMRRPKLEGTDWVPIPQDTFASLKRPERLSFDSAGAPLLPPAATAEVATRQLETLLGGAQKTFTVGEGNDSLEVVLDAQHLAEHFYPKDKERSKYFPWMLQILQNPQEIWIQFVKSQSSGKVELRSNIIGAVASEDRQRVLIFGAQLNKDGVLVDHTFLPTQDLKSINKRRAGRLIHAR